VSPILAPRAVSLPPSNSVAFERSGRKASHPGVAFGLTRSSAARGRMMSADAADTLSGKARQRL